MAVVVDGVNQSGVAIALHPLVVINVSDHFTRVRAQTEQAFPQVMGALLGTLSGRSIEIHNSYELAFDRVDGHYVLDRDYFSSKQAQFREVFPQLDYLGWYATSSIATEEHVSIHKQMLDFNESPLFLLLDPSINSTARDLPIVIYESYIDVTQGAPRTIFIEGSYKIETGEAERISVNHVATLTDSGAGTDSRLIAHLVNQKSAIKMLQSRIRILLDYAKDVQNGKMPADPALLRQIASLCHRLPAMESETFKAEAIKEYNDVLLISYLATLTRGANLINEVADKYALAYERGRRNRVPF